MNNIESAKAQIEDAKARNIPLMAITPEYMDTLIYELEGAKFAAEKHLETVEIQARIIANSGAQVPTGYRLLPVALAPHIRDALVETGKCFMPETVWAAIIAADELVNPQSLASAAPVLTDAEIELIAESVGMESNYYLDSPYSFCIDFARAIERHLAATPANNESK